MSKQKQIAYTFAVAVGTSIGIAIGGAIGEATHLLLGVVTAAGAGGIVAYASYFLATKVLSKPTSAPKPPVDI
jgi:zinc transporter ZupT